ncbi:NYN domain-containing protein [Rhizobium sp. IMFF44]|uniref:NYN domain-containing protein n=1 Tax=Rhizobium sp. IMFF44 TaxID=3342350 RepID=UPI0035B97A81
MSFSTPSATQQTSYFFVDAGSLRSHLDQTAKRLFAGQKFEIDYRKLRGSYTKAFLYDAVPVKKSDESDDDYRERTKSINEELSAASRVDGLHVYTGDARWRRNRGNEQKKVDILIAVDMLTHAFRRNMDSAFLLTGDLDFKPLLDALGREGMYTTLLYPPGHTNEELINAADAAHPITMTMLFGWLKSSSQQHFQIPKTSTLQVYNEAQFGHSLGSWETYAGGKVQLFRRRNEYVVIHPTANGSCITAWGDYEMLKIFLEDTGTMEVPDFAFFAPVIQQVDKNNGWA